MTGLPAGARRDPAATRRGRGANQRTMTSASTGSKSEVPTTEPSAFSSTPRPEVRPAERSVFERPAPLSKSAFQCFLRSCHTGCLASSDEKGGATNLARSTPPCAADPSGTLGTPAG